MSIDIKKARAKDFTMNYFSFGKGEKAFVILPGLSIQSVMNTADIIAQAYEIIAKKFTVYVFDRRQELPSSYSIYDMADDTEEVFRVLGLKEVYLFGASQGGMIAMTIAAKYPELVKKLVLGSTSAHITERQYNTISKWLFWAKAKERVKLNIEMCKDIYPTAMFEQYKTVLKKLGESITDEELERFILFAEGTRDFDISNKVVKINCPVLALNAADDKVLPGAAEELEALFSGKSNFESYMYTGYGHAAFDTAPDYKERLLRFLLSE